MANSRRALCRNCLDFVTRIGSTTPAPPAPTTSGRGDGSPLPETSSRKHSVVPAVVVVVSLAAVIGVIVVIAVLLRRKRIRDQLAVSRAAQGARGVAVEVKDGPGDPMQDENSRWSEVELVVMAGELSPSFVARALPVPSVEQSCPLPTVEIPSSETEQSRNS